MILTELSVKWCHLNSPAMNFRPELWGGIDVSLAFLSPNQAKLISLLRL